MSDSTNQTVPTPQFLPKSVQYRNMARRTLPTLLALAVIAFGLMAAGGDAIATTLNSPEFSPLGTSSIPQLIGRIIAGVLALTGVIALVMFIYGGVIWMTSQGNTEAITKAKKTIVWSILGLVLIFTSYALVNFVLQAIGQG